MESARHLLLLPNVYIAKVATQSPTVTLWLAMIWSNENCIVCTSKHEVSNCEWLKIIDIIRSLEKGQKIMVKSACPNLIEFIDKHYTILRGSTSWDNLDKIIQTMDDKCFTCLNDTKSQREKNLSRLKGSRIHVALLLPVWKPLGTLMYSSTTVPNWLD